MFTMAFSFSRSLVVGSDFFRWRMRPAETVRDAFLWKAWPADFIWGAKMMKMMACLLPIYYSAFDLILFFLLGRVLIELLFTWWPVLCRCWRFLSRYSSFTSAEYFCCRPSMCWYAEQFGVDEGGTLWASGFNRVVSFGLFLRWPFLERGPFTTVELVAAEGLTITTILSVPLIRFGVLLCLFDWPLAHL